MPTTLKAIRRQMYLLDPSLGRSESVASLTVTTVVVSALAAGGSDQRFVNWWIIRSDSTNTADRRRICTTFAPATGTLTHAGTNYADTTATDEIVELSRFEPIFLDKAIQQTLFKLLRRDTINVPLRSGKRNYYLGNDLTWLRDPNDILELRYSASPILNRNDEFNRHNTVTTGGVLHPDDWTLAGAAGTMARSTTQVDPAVANYNAAYSLAMTRSGTNLTLTQTVGLIETGVSADSLRGQAVCGFLRCWSAVASQVRLRCTDDGGSTYTSSEYHTGGSGWEELPFTKTLSATATNLQVVIAVDGSDTVCYLSRCRAPVKLAAVDDSLRRAAYQERTIPRENYRYEQGPGMLSILGRDLPNTGTLLVDSKRPYPQFDATRLTGDNADADASDAPVDIVATGALAELYRGQSMNSEHSETDRKEYASRYAFWLGKFEVAAKKHLYVPSRGPSGLPLPKAIPQYVRSI